MSNSLHVTDKAGTVGVMTVSAARASGDNTLSVSGVSHLPTGGFYFTTYSLVGGMVDKSSIAQYKGHVGTGNSIVIDSALGDGNKAGDYVVIAPSNLWSKELAQLIEKHEALLTPGGSWTDPTTGTTTNAGANAVNIAATMSDDSVHGRIIKDAEWVLVGFVKAPANGTTATSSNPFSCPTNIPPGFNSNRMRYHIVAHINPPITANNGVAAWVSLTVNKRWGNCYVTPGFNSVNKNSGDAIAIFGTGASNDIVGGDVNIVNDGVEVEADCLQLYPSNGQDHGRLLFIARGHGNSSGYRSFRLSHAFTNWDIGSEGITSFDVVSSTGVIGYHSYIAVYAKEF